jgi:mannosyltransferase OCH1-like enzyme
VQTTAPITLWRAIGSSADGSRLIAVCHTGGIYTSTNSGGTWNANSVPAYNSWDYVALSADGNRLVAPASGGGIYTSQSTPSPLLSLASANGSPALSWLVPSANFALQRNDDLSASNWVTLTNTPLLNLTNLHDEVVLVPTNGSGFFRLTSQ